MNNSIWENIDNKTKFPTLKGKHKTDVLIIGGGIAGLLCAYSFQKSGIDYMLLEGNKIINGTTKNTTAKITSQHGLIYNKLCKEIGIENTRKYLEINEIAVKKYKELCENIDCDFEIRNNYVYSQYSKLKLEEEIKCLDRIGFNAELCEKVNLPIDTVGAVKFKNQAQFNPLKFLSSISEKLNIFENSYVLRIVGSTAYTDFGSVKAERIIISTHFPFINRHGSYFLKMYQHRSYCLGFENAFKIDGMYVDEADNGLSFRNYKDYLIIGGGSHRTGKIGGNWEELRKFMNIACPEAKEKYYWAAQDCKTLDGIPYIGNYSALTPNLFLATGFNKWGMTSAFVASIILTDLVMGKKNIYADIFSPSRSILKKQLIINGFEAVTNIINFKPKRCPHLGCALKWNKAERSWDCPCHGSRFDKKGNILENPAMKNIQP